jgi:AcrR family transcriptional regulator
VRQRALVDGAIELLMERGWAATTAVAVCDRAGCTRGALIHHYPSLSALLAHALESLYEDLAGSLKSPPTTMVSTLDEVWRAVSDPRFKAVIEAWSAAGNDHELANQLRPVMSRFAKLVSPEAVGPDSPVRDANGKAFFLMAREAMLGLALGRATNGGDPLGHERIVLRRLRQEARGFDNDQKAV